MKILLDECVTRKLKNRLTGFEVFTVAEMSWEGLKNGALMSNAIQASFDIFLTIDKNLEFQQNLNKYNITLVIFDVQRSKIEFLENLLPNFFSRVKTFEKGKTYRITD